MAKDERWLRLNAAFDRSEWLYDLPPAARLAWVELLCYVKREGHSGQAKAMSHRIAAHEWRIPERDIVKMIDAATNPADDPALKIIDGKWIITKWSDYQETDSAERVRNMRQRKHENRNNVTSVTDVTDVTVTTVARDRDRDSIPPEMSTSLPPYSKIETNPLVNEILTRPELKRFKLGPKRIAEAVAGWQAKYADDYILEVLIAFCDYCENNPKYGKSFVSAFGNWLKPKELRQRGQPQLLFHPANSPPEVKLKPNSRVIE